MNILPIYANKAKNEHWVVQCLRGAGYCICIFSSIGGIATALTVLLPFAQRMGFGGSSVILNLCFAGIGAIVGFLLGLLVGLPFWGLALLLDDVHALRIYASGYFTDEGDPDADEGDDAPVSDPGEVVADDVPAPLSDASEPESRVQFSGAGLKLLYVLAGLLVVAVVLLLILIFTR